MICMPSRICTFTRVNCVESCRRPFWSLMLLFYIKISRAEVNGQSNKRLSASKSIEFERVMEFTSLFPISIRFRFPSRAN